MITHSKRYRTARDVADLTKAYPLKDAVALLARMPKAKFDETVELSIKLDVDPKQSAQMVRGVVNLPKGSGKKVRVLVFTDSPADALAAGADFAGLGELITKIESENFLGFDVAIATTAAMKEVRKLARILGPRGLMPNPKTGTVTDNVVNAIKDIKLGGRVEFKMDKTANVGVVVGKRSFTAEDLVENINTVVDAVHKARPNEIKGKLVKSMTICSTMSPGIKLDPAIFSSF
ncbi:MAG: 50S ribosomal protein L1 [Verrucomicrobiota bacterium]|nr:50S ribosomal protein L1 [Verrucomicrobiota bacterium]